MLRTANRTAGQRAAATVVTSRSAALARPVISPTVAGRNGIGRLSRASNSPSASSSRRSRSMRASSSPIPTARISLSRNENVPRPVKKFGLPQTTTCTPSASLTGALSTRSRGAVTVSDMSAAGSRSTMNTVLMPGRMLIWVNWPSTQTVPNLSIQLAIRMATARTGNGFSAEFVAGP